MEPLTALTDAILAAWTSLLSALLFARARGRRPVILWACGFAATAAGALAGAAYHYWRVPWMLIPVTTGAAALCLGCAVAVAWFGPAARRVAVALLIAELIACVIASTMSDSFVIVAVDYGPVLLMILVACIIHRRERAARLIAAGIAVAFIALGVEASSLRLGVLDHNDLFHAIQMAAMFLLYRGGASFSAAS